MCAENGKAGLVQFLGRISDYGRIKRKRWLITGLFLLPTVYVITYLVMRLADYPPAQHLNFSSVLISALATFL